MNRARLQTAALAPAPTVRAFLRHLDACNITHFAGRRHEGRLRIVTDCESEHRAVWREASNAGLYCREVSPHCQEIIGFTHPPTQEISA